MLQDMFLNELESRNFTCMKFTYLNVSKYKLSQLLCIFLFCNAVIITPKLLS